MPTLTKCSRCGYVSSQKLCKACILLEGLNKGLPRLGIGKTSRINRVIHQSENNSNEVSCSGSETNCNNCHKKSTQIEKKTCSCQKPSTTCSLEIEEIIKKITL